MIQLLDKLNKNQKEAVLHTDGPLLILAGAGSGKTRVITYRVAFLVKEKKIPPYNIMAVTFTNKAAAEMKKRVIDLVGPEGNSVFIKTFHSAAVYILRKYGEKIGIPHSFSIYDTSDQEALIKDILMEMRLDPKKIKPRTIASRISEIKNRPEFFTSGPDSLMPDNLPFNFPEIYSVYHRRLRNLCSLDFDDLLIETTRLLSEYPEETAKMQTQWKYFMIDEYQDTNHAQYLICKYLSSSSRNLCVVGDDDQSIYSWRGADIRNILNFEKDYSDAKVVTLAENYRSTMPILESASYVIKNNRQRKDKRLKAVRGEGESVVWCQTNNEYGEAEYVVNMILTMKNREGLRNKDFAIFYRTNAQSRVFEDYLRRENIPYRIVGGLKFYDRKEIKDILAYLRVIANPADIVSMLRIINTPARGLGNATIDALRETAKSEGFPEWDIIDKEYRIKGKLPRGLIEFRKIIKDGMETAKDIPDKLSLADFVSGIIETSGYKKNLEDEDTLESRARLENIAEFLNSIYDYEAMNMRVTLDEFLQTVSLLSSEEDPALVDETGAITLMTVHIAKGLEFPVVFLTGMEDGTFPHSMSSDTEEGLEEERRLCYVGITRAMNKLYITNAGMRRSFSELRYKIPSRFIHEIPEELLEPAEYFSGEFASRTVNTFDYGRSDSGYSRIETVDDNYSSDSRNSSRFLVREIVMHPKYGTGIVTGIKGNGDNIKLTISFNGRSKTFLEKYANLEKMG
ncbi:MAG: UvrD-helicase domain-containing protein [Spirochaetes bacterium]|nr:UvrD-helicase domain-containing protein [Spirochaetota bacterium]